jgi:hypothetical protein
MLPNTQESPITKEGSCVFVLQMLRGHLKTLCIMWRKQCALKVSPTILGELHRH